jgi:hypothetical protein
MRTAELLPAGARGLRIGEPPRVFPADGEIEFAISGNCYRNLANLKGLQSGR